MDFDNDFTALIIAVFVVSLIAGLAIYYNNPSQSNNVQPALHLQNSSESHDNNQRLGIG